MIRFASSIATAVVSALALAAVAAEPVTPKVQDTLTPLPPASVKFNGWLGQQIATCREGRMLKQSIPDLIKPFQQRDEVKFWQTEFWGKWFTSAILSWRYDRDAAMAGRLDEAVSELLKTQTPDGYIGNYKPEAQTKQWDIWGRKYVILGLLMDYDRTGDPRTLAAAVKEADYTMGQVGPGKADIVTTGNWTGMASSSILEPMVLLYCRTGEPRFLEFALDIVAKWEGPAGPDLLRKALAGTNVYDMFPTPDPSKKGYMSGGQSKAYEMMSCYEGLLELHRVTGKPEYAEAVKRVVANIAETEITILGSGSSWERWCRGRGRQTEQVNEWMETCVGATWIKINGQLLRLTGEPQYADAIEQTAYNALTGAQAVDGTWWSHYNFMEGTRLPAPEQCKMHANCCVASGPRALNLLPMLAVMSGKQGPVVNFYEPATVDAGAMKLTIEGDYPRQPQVTITVQPAAATASTISLRIPAWSKQTTVTVNGQSAGQPVPGQYLRIARTWQVGDKIAIQFDLSTRIERDPGKSTRLAVVRGPVVLALDKRLTAVQPTFGPAALVADNAGCLAATLVTEPLAAKVLLAVDVPVTTADGRAATVRMCNFSSAGTTWDATSIYRVWLPQPINLADPLGDVKPTVEHH